MLTQKTLKLAAMIAAVSVLSVQTTMTKAHDGSHSGPHAGRPGPHAQPVPLPMRQLSRVDVYALNPFQRNQIAAAIHEYITDQHVIHHATMDPRVHREGQMFLQMHRQMIRDLEQFLNRRGFPLPTWNPATPIPPEFTGVEPDQFGRQRPPLQNVTPMAPLPLPLQPHLVRQFWTEQNLGDAIIPWHNAVHTRIGGAMGQPETSAAASIFWCFHAYIDDIYAFWQRR